MKNWMLNILTDILRNNQKLRVKSDYSIYKVQQRFFWVWVDIRTLYRLQGFYPYASHFETIDKAKDFIIEHFGSEILSEYLRENTNSEYFTIKDNESVKSFIKQLNDFEGN